MASRKCLFILLTAAFVSLLFFFFSAISGFTTSYSLLYTGPEIVRGPLNLPSFAFYLSGSLGDANRLLRLLLAVYHPRNRYLLHLSWEASDSERAYLAKAALNAAPVIRAVGNVDVLGLGDSTSLVGSSGMAATLHAAAVMLRSDGEWDWFVNLDAADYPLVSQDVLHTMINYDEVP